MFPIEPILYNLMSALIGFFTGNRLAIDRDRRREFNDLVNPIRLLVLEEREKPTSRSISPTNIEFALVREKLFIIKRKSFDRAVVNYKKSKGADNQEQSQTSGQPHYKDTTIIVHAIDDLLKFLKPRR